MTTTPKTPSRRYYEMINADIEALERKVRDAGLSFGIIGGIGATADPADRHRRYNLGQHRGQALNELTHYCSICGNETNSGRSLNPVAGWLPGPEKAGDLECCRDCLDEWASQIED